MDPLKLGQMVYFVPSEKRDKPMSLEVLRLGNTWAYLGNGYEMYKANKVTWEMGKQKFGYTFPGMIFESQEKYRERIANETP